MLNENETCIKIYNSEKKELIGTYDSVRKAAQVLGVNRGSVTYSISNKSNFISPHLNMRVACRKYELVTFKKPNQ